MSLQYSLHAEAIATASMKGCPQSPNLTSRAARLDNRDWITEGERTGPQCRHPSTSCSGVSHRHLQPQEPWVHYKVQINQQIDQMGLGQFGPGINILRQALHEEDMPETEYEQHQRQLAWLSDNHMPLLILAGEGCSKMGPAGLASVVYLVTKH